MAQQNLPPTLTSRYKPQQLLGAGGAGHVILAEDTQLGRQVAVKVLSGRSVIASASRFLAEAQALSRLSHPHILEMFDYGVVDEVAYLVLEYVQGGSMDEWVRGKRRATQELRVVAGKVLDALEHAHTAGVIHRDLKPANVLLTGDGEPKLADFGLARHSSSQVRTASGLLVGTPEFMAPEVFKGSKAGPEADFFAWGCLLHALEFGHPPYEGELPEIVKAACRGQVPQKARRSEFRNVYLASLSPDPEARAAAGPLRQLLSSQAPQNLPTQVQYAIQPSGISAPVAAARQDADGSAPTISIHSGSTPGLPSQPPSASRLRPLAVGLGGLALIGGATWALLPGAPPPAPVVATRDPARVALEWRERLESFRIDRGTAREVMKLHAAAYGSPPDTQETYSDGQEYPGGERHQAVMYEVRVGRIRDSRLEDMAPSRVEALPPLIQQLPFREDFAADREALREYQADPTQPFAKRLELHHAVQALEHIDAYVEAWGLPALYRASTVTQVLAPVRVARRYPPAHHSYAIEDATNFARPDIREEPLGEDVPEAGDHMLYHWSLNERRRMPFIIQDPYNPSHLQQVTLSFFKAFTLSFGGDLNQVYKNVALRVNLGDAPRERYGSLRLVVVAANCIAPDALRISFNDLRSYFRPGPGDSDRWSYVISAQPEYDLHLDLPPETWQAGDNQLVLKIESVPGINHRQGMDVFEVRLEATAKEDS